MIVAAALLLFFSRLLPQTSCVFLFSYTQRLCLQHASLLQLCRVSLCSIRFLAVLVFVARLLFLSLPLLFLSTVKPERKRNSCSVLKINWIDRPSCKILYAFEQSQLLRSVKRHSTRCTRIQTPKEFVPVQISSAYRSRQLGCAIHAATPAAAPTAPAAAPIAPAASGRGQQVFFLANPLLHTVRQLQFYLKKTDNVEHV